MRLKATKRTHAQKEGEGYSDYTVIHEKETITLNLDDFEVVDNLELFNEYFHNLENYEVKYKPNTPKCTCLQNPLLVCKKHDDKPPKEECTCKIGFTDPDCPESKPPKIEKYEMLEITDETALTPLGLIQHKINQLVDAIEEMR